MQQRIVILGGGTAGWMAACLFAHAWPEASVTVVESPEIGVVGVGEGSTPQLRAFFAKLGIAEAEWMPACNATYKAGIEFRGWSELPGFDRYFHPFASELDVHTQPQFHYNTLARRRGADVPAHPDRFFVNTAIARRALAPLPVDSFPFDIGYGYHFDAHLVGAFLRTHAVARGVVHLSRRVVEVAIGEAGDIGHLVTEDAEAIGGDLFVDCSGFRSVIAQQALDVRFLPFGANLFNDSAVVMPTPRPERRIEPQTVSTALSNGWAWSIPLTNRTGNGYVYSSRYCSAEAAEAELRRHLGLGEDVAARHLSMKVGRVEHSWYANCLAVGLAQGFIEPLEATALHLVEATVEQFIRAYEAGGLGPAQRDTFNSRIARRYEGVRDYIVAHYRLNRRSDTQYWRANAANNHLSDDLKAIVTAWFTCGDVPGVIMKRDLAGFYAPASWECLLAGYGNFPEVAPAAFGADEIDMSRVDDFMARCLLNFGGHTDALDRLAQR
jgi:2-polyprenyl-6-methoxyphenol hydroxylase-like FAD-dependent oxidoreductase